MATLKSKSVKTKTGRRVIVALHGFPGSGKDTVAAALRSAYGFQVIAFSDSLYSAVAVMMSVDIGYLRDREIKNTPQDRLSLYYAEDPSYRQFMASRGFGLFDPRTSRFHLDNYGTDFWGRLDPRIWANRTVMEIETHAEIGYVIPDLRTYEDLREYWALRELTERDGSLLRVIEIVRDPRPEGAYDPNSPIHMPLPTPLIDARIVNPEGRVDATIHLIRQYIDEALAAN